MVDDSTTVSFGGLQLTVPEVLEWTSHNAINEIATCRISLNSRSPLLHSLALNEPVVVLANEHGVFAGDVVSASLDGETLVVDCSSAPQMETTRGAAVTKVHPTQLVRLIALDADAKLPDSDDDNELCPAATRGLDWDALIGEMDRAPDFLSLAAVTKEHLSRSSPTPQEQRLVRQVLGRIHKEIADIGLDDVPAASITREHYEAALPDIWATTWRFRVVPDSYEVAAPLRQIGASSTPITVGSVDFCATDVGTDDYLGPDADDSLRTGWLADAYARVVVEASDMWTAKWMGLTRIREAMAAIGFAYTYSPWVQKLGDHDYRPMEYARPAGAPGTIGTLARVVNQRSGEYWLGSVKGTPDPCDLEALQSLRGSLLAQASAGGEDNELLRHVRRALSWRYRSRLSTVPVDAFLYVWVSLEMLFQRPHENTSVLVRRLPFAILSVGDKLGPIRTELQRSWIPLRDEIVHRAILDHPDIDQAVRRVHFFSDCAISYAMEFAQHSPDYDEWLDHLDLLSRTKPT